MASGYLDLIAVNLAKRTITVAEFTIGPSGGIAWLIGDKSVSPKTRITIDGKDAQLADLQAEHIVLAGICRKRKC